VVHRLGLHFSLGKYHRELSEAHHICFASCTVDAGSGAQDTAQELRATYLGRNRILLLLGNIMARFLFNFFCWSCVPVSVLLCRRELFSTTIPLILRAFAFARLSEVKHCDQLSIQCLGCLWTCTCPNKPLKAVCKVKQGGLVASVRLCLWQLLVGAIA